VEWIKLAYGRDRFWAVVNVVMKIPILKKLREVLK
jgi:hypothetical protein